MLGVCLVLLAVNYVDCHVSEEITSSATLSAAARSNVVVPEKKVELDVTTSPKTLPPYTYQRRYRADELTTIDDYPYMAALLVNNTFWCSAVVIHERHVLLAALCLQRQYNSTNESVDELSVRVGSTNASEGGLVSPVNAVYFHPNYNSETLTYNFAVLKLVDRVERRVDGVRVRRVSLWPLAVVTHDNKDLTFVGWQIMRSGPNTSEVLLHMQLPLYNQQDCQDLYGRALVHETHFCAGYISKKANICNHEAGGAAIVDGLLLGLLSFSNLRCDERDRPAVFSNVGAVRTWALSVVPDLLKEKTERKSRRPHRRHY